MAVNANQYIMPPISVRDLQEMFGLSSPDLATLIKNANINKWAKWKPIIYPNAIGNLTQQQFIDKAYGLVPQTSSLALQVCDNMNGVTHNLGQSGYSFKDVLATFKEWTYNRPTGGLAAPFRITDFTDPNNHGANGYNHLSAAPCDFQQWDIKLSDLNKLASDFSSPTVGSDGSDPCNTVITAISSVLYQHFQMRFGDSSGDTIGYTASDTIPLTQVLSGLNTRGNWFRIGVLIQYQQMLYLVVSRATIWEYYNSKDSTIKGNVAYLMPALETNCDFAFTLYNYYNQKNNNLTLQGIPCIVKNAILTEEGNRSTIQLNSNSVIYSPPSNTHQIDFNILSSSSSATDTPIEQVASEIVLRQVGSTNIDGTMVSLYDLVLVRYENEHIRYDYSWSCDVQGSSGGGGNYRTTRSDSGSHTFSGTEREFVLVKSVPFVQGTLHYTISRVVL